MSSCLKFGVGTHHGGAVSGVRAVDRELHPPGGLHVVPDPCAVGYPNTKDAADWDDHQRSQCQQRATSGQANELSHGSPSSWIVRVNGSHSAPGVALPSTVGKLRETRRGKGLNGWRPAFEGLTAAVSGA